MGIHKRARSNKRNTVKWRSNGKKNENKRERFEFYREKRLKNAINAIKLCQNMANKNSYEYTAEEGGMIIKYLEEAMRDLKHAFRSSTKKETKYFE